MGQGSQATNYGSCRDAACEADVKVPVTKLVVLFHTKHGLFSDASKNEGAVNLSGHEVTHLAQYIPQLPLGSNEGRMALLCRLLFASAFNDRLSRKPTVNDDQ